MKEIKLKGYQLEFDSIDAYFEKYDHIYFVFLRQLGCIFCRDLVGILKSQVEIMPRFPKLLFFHPGNLEQGEFYFSDKFPSAEAVADPNGEIYGTFNFHEGKWYELFHPKTFAKAFQAYRRGARQGETMGNVKFMGGVLLYKNGELFWEHRSKYAGDLPSVSTMIGKAKEAGVDVFNTAP